MAHKGTPNFVMQRASAVVLAPIAVWFLFNIVVHVGADLAAATAWVRQPLNAILLGAFIAIGGFHMRIGVQEAIDDYLAGPMNKAAAYLNWALSVGTIVLAAWSVFSLLSVG